jgi:protein O-mannosyl-transferase
LQSKNQNRNLILSLLLAALTLALYNQANRHPFINYDDDRYVTENAHLREGLSWQTFTWALTSTEQANWHPLSWMSHALDVSLFRMNPAGHHLTSVFLHTLSAMMLFLLLATAAKRIAPAFWVATLFALHPINVESVAWIAERKNVLCTLFFLLTLGAYGWYSHKPGWPRYLTVLSVFALGLMAKPMVITLPCVLLLLDYWPLQRDCAFSELLLEKVPLFALSVASAIITMQAQQQGGAMRSTVQFSLVVRIENALVAYASYLWKLVWPVKLAPLYPHPGENLPGWEVGISLLVLIGISLLVWKFRRSGYLLTGWLWFLGTLVPVIGLVQVGDQAMADRYAYIPLIGIFIMIAFSFDELAQLRRMSQSARIVPWVCTLIAFSIVTYRQLGYWASSYDLWSHTLAVTENNFIAQDNLGGALILLGRPGDAYPHFQAAAEINPRDPMSHSNLGTYLLEKGQLQEAVAQYETTIRLTSDRGLLANTYANLGTAHRELGNVEKSRDSYEEAIRLNPGQFNAYYGRGRLLEQESQWDDAIADYRQSVSLHPTADGYFRLGQALRSSRRDTEAAAAYQQALSLDPDLAEARHALQALGGPH